MTTAQNFVLISTALVLMLPASAQAEDFFLSADIDRLEYRLGKGGRDTTATEARVSYGGNHWKLHGLLEAEYSHDEDAWEALELQGRFSIPIADYWDAFGGVRHDDHSHPARSYVAMGITGLAPYFIETDMSLFLSERGGLSARLKVEKDFLFTQRLIMQPQAEIDIVLRNGNETNTEKKNSVSDLGVRLRYEITRDVAPYIGINYEREWGGNGHPLQGEKEQDSALSFLVGLKLSY